MATIRKLIDKWQAQVRRKGSPPRARSFETKVEAEWWARGLEAERGRCGSLPDNRAAEQITIRAMFERYLLKPRPLRESSASCRPLPSCRRTRVGMARAIVQKI